MDAKNARVIFVWDIPYNQMEYALMDLSVVDALPTWIVKVADVSEGLV